MNKKGFTLIELLAVIVVLAILALVVTPIVLNIVENAQTGSDERSVESYAKVMQTTYYEEKMNNTALTLQEYLDKVDTASGESLTYNGSKVVCETKKVSESASGTQIIELYNCTVDGREYYNFANGKAEKVGSSNSVSNVPTSKSFVEDSWKTIIAALKTRNTSVYKVGDTKEITVSEPISTYVARQIFIVRIANKSTTAERNTEGFLQTTCGFVSESCSYPSYPRYQTSCMSLVFRIG